LKIKHDSSDAHCNLGMALMSKGRTDEAVAEYQESLSIKRNHVDAHCNLGVALVKQGRIKEAIAHYHAALKTKADDPPTLNNLAWLRATHPNAAFRDSGEAVELAQRALQLSNGRAPAVLDTLAAAYAEAGRFPEAVRTARKAVDLAEQQHKQAMAEEMMARLRLYEAGTPYREPLLLSR
jgi:Flp pilus assembly protein TadD